MGRLVVMKCTIPLLGKQIELYSNVEFLNKDKYLIEFIKQ
jgi:hypothetical protein